MSDEEEDRGPVVIGVSASEKEAAARINDEDFNGGEAPLVRAQLLRLVRTRWHNLLV